MSKKKIEHNLPATVYVEDPGEGHDDSLNAADTKMKMYSHVGVHVDDGPNTFGVYKLVKVIRCVPVDSVRTVEESEP
jgi:hypothetical protein